MKNDQEWLPGAREARWIEGLMMPILPALEAIETAAAPDRIPIVDPDNGPGSAWGSSGVADNVLRRGRVTDAAITDQNPRALRDFDAGVLGDKRFTATILPVGDGLLVAGLRG